MPVYSGLMPQKVSYRTPRPYAGLRYDPVVEGGLVPAPAFARVSNGQPEFYSPPVNPVTNPMLRQVFNEGVNLANQPIPIGTTATVRNPAQANRLTESLRLHEAPKAAATQSLIDFTKEALAARPSSKAALDQESSAINRTYDPAGLEAALARTRASRYAATRDAASRGLRMAGRDNSFARMTGGNSSYLDRAYGDTLANILTKAQIEGSDLERTDLGYVQGQRTGLLGQRQALMDRYLQSGLAPQEAYQRSQAGDLANLRGMADLENLNTDYRYTSPEDAWRRRLGLIGSLGELERSFV